MKKLFRDIIELIIRFIETSKPIIIVMIIAITVLGIITGYKYYQFTREDPQFCELCHLVKEPYKSWQKSSHRSSVCQVCHSMNIVEQNKLLIGYVVSGGKGVSQKHGRLAPWGSCKKCHLDEVTQGGITMRKSYGHARHVFMENIECKKCHTANMHNFAPDEKNCMICHEDKGVHGMGMESFACLSCHIYGETYMIKKQRCLGCHKDIPKKGPMIKVDCQNCHKPHGRLRPTANDCFSNCHTNQKAMGRHDKHIKISCLECHKAHIWKVGQKQALSLCSKCHKYSDPSTFLF